MDFSTFILIYIVFRLKQFVCDFLLQTDWMAMTKGKPGIDGYKALFSHTAVHAGATLLIMLVFMPALWWLAPVDFVIHSAVDRAKGMLTYKMKWSYTDKWFWWSFGLDQEAHNFTHMGYVALMALHAGGIHMG
jgi:hypothetical protein